MLVAVVAIGGAVFLFARMDEEIRHHVEKGLAEKFPQLNVSVGGARWVKGRGVAIYDVAVSETTSTQLQNHLLFVDEIMLTCDAGLRKLVHGLPEIKSVVLKRPQLWVARTASGHWNLERCLPLPACGEKRPQIVIQDAQVALVDLGQLGLPQLALRDVNFTIHPQNEESPLTGSLLAAAGRPVPEQSIPSNCEMFDIHGTMGGPDLSRAEFHAQFDRKNQLLHFEATIEQLQLTKELQAWASATCDSWDEASSLEGRLDGSVVIQHQFVGGALPQVDAHLHFSEGRLLDARLPRPLTDLVGTIHCQNNILRVEELRGKCDTANLALHLERRGWRSDAPLAMGLRIEDLPLDENLYRVLPALLQREWDKYQPTGVVGADVQVTFDGRVWQPLATLTGRQLAFESEKFKYRVRNGSGTMGYTPSAEGQPALLDIDLIGYGGGQQLTIRGQAFDPKPGALGWVEITGSGLTIEKSMIGALPKNTRQVIESLRPQGHFNVRWRLARTRAGQAKPNTSLRLELVDCGVSYRQFPYPLSGIHGLILAEDGRWTFRDLIASGSRRVECQGYLRPQSDGKELSLRFTGSQVPLDDDLKQALPAKVRRAWDEVRPGGRVDLIADIYHQTGDREPAIRVSVNPRPESATIQPVFFPYRLKGVEGRFDYLDGELLVTNFHGKHGPTTVRTNGNGNFAPDGAWQFELTGLSVDRLEARRDLLAALPQKMRKLIEQLRISGKFSLHDTTLKFSKSKDPAAGTRAQWDAQLSCLQADLHPGIDLQNVHGTVRLVGTSEGDTSYSTGELALETVTFEDVQFTNVRGPLWIDETSYLLGNWATQRQNLAPRHVTANVYDGTLISDVRVTFDGVPRYSVIAWLTGADLPRMTKERFQTDQELLGKVAATLTLNGYGRSLHTLSGHGEVQVADANIYKLPLLVGMLKVLRNAAPDTTAFNQVNTKYRIEGRHIYLDQLDFLGDAVSLLGKGETNFDQQLNLVFHGVVGRNQIQLPLVKNFFDQVGQQTMQMYVDGTLSAPQIRTQALPGINQLIQDVANPTSSVAPRGAARLFPALPRWAQKK
ncbi:MAG: AsmA-like C-terminal region-containing protein [Pirellulales bacterium]|nr:AsmA-like C-terminal region-containing protein [Pirellulales bacterium]